MIDSSTLRQAVRDYSSSRLFKKNLAVTLLLVTLPLCIICVVIYKTSSNIIEKSIQDLNQESIYRMKDVIDTIVSESKLLAASFSLKDETKTYMQSGIHENTASRIPYELADEIKTYAGIHRYIHSVYLYSENQNYIVSNIYNGMLENAPDKNWLSRYGTLDTDNVSIYIRKNDSGYPYFITIVKPVYFFNQDKLGAVVVNIDIETLGKLFQKTGNIQPQNSYLVDNASDSVVVYNRSLPAMWTQGDDLAQLGPFIREEGRISVTDEFGGEKYILSAVPSTSGPWTYVGAYPLSYYDEKLNIAKHILVYFIAGVTLIGIGISFILSVRSFQPVKNIVSVLKDPSKLQPQAEPDRQLSKSRNELDYIQAAIWQSVQSHKEMEDALKQRLELLKHAQAAALQSQINPHFLGNTLDSIKWEAMELTGGKNPVSSMVTKLAHLFHLGLNMKERLVPISTEMDHAKLYVEIMKYRYNDLFEVEWMIEPALYNHKIVKLSFQPLIENAIQHGLKPKKKDGRLLIQGETVKDQIHIRFIDNGVGMAASLADELNGRMNGETAEVGEHIGIQNVNQRIKLIFGSPYGVTIADSSDAGTTIVVRIPL
ncbi:two-component system, sensor histidine kinase YesM [Paenibacillus sp. UNCCL117]|uniref:sensor histidine kinase n=1 Tax=unclassified Paenibacillus TaxID=185978 RepID=UPI00088F4E96|nr:MULTISPECIES: sensor histidine kinase [unclassified Paenibacillus]SDC94614.1 two-component system, sensor histidine kinase YesM [Paenibacillus sp. cl123]SFW29853.1 two-component system, sensor histidine kinase YesM [Paenibacillus sp. UNCCL117]